jgi:hypothetical protein
MARRAAGPDWGRSLRISDAEPASVLCYVRRPMTQEIIIARLRENEAELRAA